MAGASKKKSDDPISVLLPRVLRQRLAAEATRRGLKMSPMIRVLIGERIDELEIADRLTRAEQWQRAQAWSTWEEIKTSGLDERSDGDLDRVFADSTVSKKQGRKSRTDLRMRKKGA